MARKPPVAALSRRPEGGLTIKQPSGRNNVKAGLASAIRDPASRSSSGPKTKRCYGGTYEGDLAAD